MFDKMPEGRAVTPERRPAPYIYGSELIQAFGFGGSHRNLQGLGKERIQGMGAEHRGMGIRKGCWAQRNGDKKGVLGTEE